jgi:protein-disulfide isomerase
MSRKALGAALTAAPVLLGCGPALPPPAPTSVQAPKGTDAAGALAPGEPDSLVPVEADDATNGKPDALVTLVVFLDYECPFCAEAHDTIRELRDHYSPDELRIVYKHNPLPFHASALPAALAAQAVLDLAGESAFERYGSTLFDHRLDLTDGNLVTWAAKLGVDPASFKAIAASARVQAEVQHDVAVAQSLGETATPAFRINGIEVVGARPIEVFEQVIDLQIEAAQTLVTGGTPRRGVYPLLVAKNRDTRLE